MLNKWRASGSVVLCWPARHMRDSRTCRGARPLLRDASFARSHAFRLPASRMRPAHAVNIETHTFAFEAELGYQNTWALSENVEKYLTSLETSGRRQIGPAEIEAIRDLPGENYLLDLESATLDMAVHYKISNQWTFILRDGSVVQGGFLDSTIEGFHDLMGLSSYGRLAPDAMEFTDLRPQGREVVLTRSTAEARDSSIRLSGCVTAASLPGKWRMSVETAVKAAFERRRGRCCPRAIPTTDCRRRCEGSAIATPCTWISRPCTTPGKRCPAADKQVIPTIVIGWERQMCARTNMNLQGYASKSVYRPSQTDLDELLSRQVPDEPRRASPVRLLSRIVRHHRESAEPQQHAGHRLPDRIRVVAAAQAAAIMGTFLICCK